MTYIQGFMVPVPNAKKDAYREMAARTSAIFREYGAERVVEAWGDDVPDGEVTDFKRAVRATPEETVMFAWIVWPDKATWQAAQARMGTDERMRPEGGMPFDGRRMIFGGFVPLFDSEG